MNIKVHEVGDSGYALELSHLCSTLLSFCH